MKHTLTPQRYLILLAVMLTASVGDTLLSRGMAQVGAVDVHHLGLLWHALFNPYVDSGIVLPDRLLRQLHDRAHLGRPHLRHARHSLRLRRRRAAQPLLAA